MKQHLSFLIVCCLAATNVFAGGTVKLSGKITHPISDSISVRYTESWLGFEPVKIGARLNADGTFSLSFPLQFDYTSVMIEHGEQGTEITPVAGDDLVMTIDAANFDSSLSYTGRGADVANFVAAHMLARSFSSRFASRVDGACAAAPDSFLIRSHTSLQKEQDFLDKNGAALPTAFKKRWMDNFRYELYLCTLNYPAFHQMQVQHSYSITKFDSADFRVLAAVPAAFDDALLPLSSYRNYVTTYYATLLHGRDMSEGKNWGNHDSEIVQLVRTHMPARTAEVYEAMTTCQRAAYETYKELVAREVAFERQYPHSQYLPQLREKMVQKKKLAAGSPAIDFPITTADGRKMKLSDLRGKVVYLDFWATWCGPCKAEMPSAKKLEEKYKDKDVVFLSVSIDADEAAWKELLAKTQDGGLNMRDGKGGWNAPVATAYGIRSVPSYFLIDKNGNFALDTTPRPSDSTELTGAIDKLLEQPRQAMK